MTEENGFPVYPNPAKKAQFGDEALGKKTEFWGQDPFNMPPAAKLDQYVPSADERDNWDIDLPPLKGNVRTFQTGATRDTDDGKIDLEGFLNPAAVEAFGLYMHYNRVQSDGTLRDSDNWQRGIPNDQYVKSLWRHFLSVWKWNRGYPIREGIVFALCGVLFNAFGILANILKENPKAAVEAVAVQPSKLVQPIAAGPIEVGTERSYNPKPEPVGELRGGGLGGFEQVGVIGFPGG